MLFRLANDLHHAHLDPKGSRHAALQRPSGSEDSSLLRQPKGINRAFGLGGTWAKSLMGRLHGRIKESWA